MFLSLLWYAVNARKWFRGPRINVEHLMYGEAREQGLAEKVQGNDAESPNGDAEKKEIQI